MIDRETGNIRMKMKVHFDDMVSCADLIFYPMTYSVSYHKSVIMRTLTVRCRWEG